MRIAPNLRAYAMCCFQVLKNICLFQQTAPGSYASGAFHLVDPDARICQNLRGMFIAVHTQNHARMSVFACKKRIGIL